MGGFFLNKRGVLGPIALVAAMAFVAVGCGGSDGNSDQVTVDTGSLSKAEFINQANEICRAVRAKFTREFTAFYKTNKPGRSRASEEKWLGEALDEVVLPNYEKQLIGDISTLGAPPAEKAKASAFLNSLQKRLDEIREEPGKLNETPFPFKAQATLAQKYGFSGCASSFS